MCKYCDCRDCDKNGESLRLNEKTIKTPLFEIDLCLDLDKYSDGEMFICAYLSGECDMISVKKKIKYCPFCGRKL